MLGGAWLRLGRVDGHAQRARQRFSAAHAGRRTGPLRPWTRTRADGAQLEATIHAVPEASYRTIWVILFKEDQPAPAKWASPLTPKEREVAVRITRGWDNRLIAEDLGCALDTVKKHISHIFQKLRIEKRTA